MPKRKLTGQIVSDKMDKTAVIQVGQLKKHPKYRRYFRSHKRYKAHDENNEYKTGEKVIIEEIRPLSKEKTWKIVGRVNSK